jgi:predicted DNA-binding transcriptional regulator AlpA
MNRPDPERTTNMSTSASDSDQPGLWSLTETARTSAEAIATKPKRRTSPPQPRQPSPPREVENLWDIDEVGRYLGISKITIYGWRKANYGPPAMKIGKHLRWRPAMVITWAEEHELPVG